MNFVLIIFLIVWLTAITIAQYRPYPGYQYQNGYGTGTNILHGRPQNVDQQSTVQYGPNGEKITTHIETYSTY
ncbi:unnamed protein product [Ceutorhynchus assimilis]|uniref:Uncharacterized protein n=1 Tax=Ceutorhynchus assimilis TaxID=467358 RepID=A0A9N9QQJ9_9CUCU|nr:unnamed protein product [Ceutorhynchus assimilis]